MPVIAVIGAVAAIGVASATVAAVGITVASVFTIVAAVGATMAAIGTIAKIKELQIAGTVLGIVGGIGALASSAGVFSSLGQIFEGSSGAVASSGQATAAAMPTAAEGVSASGIVPTEATYSGSTAGAVMTDVTPTANVGTNFTADAAAAAGSANPALDASYMNAAALPPDDTNIVTMVAGAGEENVINVTEVAADGGIIDPAAEAIPDVTVADSQTPASLVDTPTDTYTAAVDVTDPGGGLQQTGVTDSPQYTVDADGTFRVDGSDTSYMTQAADAGKVTPNANQAGKPPAAADAARPGWAAPSKPDTTALPPGVTKVPEPPPAELINAPVKAAPDGSNITQSSIFDQALNWSGKNSNLVMSGLMGAASFASGMMKGEGSEETAAQAEANHAAARFADAQAAVLERRMEHGRGPALTPPTIAPLGPMSRLTPEQAMVQPLPPRSLVDSIYANVGGKITGEASMTDTAGFNEKTPLSNSLLQAAETALEKDMTEANRKNYLRILVMGMQQLLRRGEDGLMATLQTSKDPVKDCALASVNLVAIMRGESQGTMPVPAMVPAAMSLMLNGLDFAERIGMVKVGQRELARAGHIFTNRIFKVNRITPAMVYQATGAVNKVMEDPAKMEAIKRRAGVVRDPRASTPTEVQPVMMARNRAERRQQERRR